MRFAAGGGDGLQGEGPARSSPAARRPAFAAAVLAGRLDAAIRGLPPGYFSLVMATGIVSIATALLRAGPTWILFRIDEVFYGVLCALTLVRVARHSRSVGRDFADPARAPGMFAAVAATCVVGAEVVVLTGNLEAAVVLWAAGALLWGLLTYAFAAAAVVRPHRLPIEEALTGDWLLLVVATQAVSALGTLVDARLGAWAHAGLFFALAMYLLGGALYLLLISLIVYRLMFFGVTARDLGPAYWINMGAMAISTLAGAQLIAAAGRWPWLVALLPFLVGLTVLYWAAATWWIPLLAVLGVWRHGPGRVRLAYDPSYWALVFPLGMYTAATFALARAAPALAFLDGIAAGFYYVALAAWLVTCAGLLWTVGAGIGGAIGAACAAASSGE